MIDHFIRNALPSLILWPPIAAVGPAVADNLFYDVVKVSASPAGETEMTSMSLSS